MYLQVTGCGFWKYSPKKIGGTNKNNKKIPFSLPHPVRQMANSEKIS
jgi:hypothetical protein